MADLVVVANSVQEGTGAQRKTVTAGANITAGQCVYLDSSGDAQPADADASDTATAVGIALHSCQSGQPITYQVAGTIALGVAPADGTPYFVSTNAGGIAPHADLSSGDFVSLLGVGNGTDLVMHIFNSGLDVA